MPARVEWIDRVDPQVDRCPCLICDQHCTGDSSARSQLMRKADRKGNKLEGSAQLKTASEQGQRVLVIDIPVHLSPTKDFQVHVPTIRRLRTVAR